MKLTKRLIKTSKRTVAFGLVAAALLGSQSIFADGNYQNYIIGKMNVTNFPANVVPGKYTHAYYGHWCDASGNEAGGPPSQVIPNSPNSTNNQFGVCGNEDAKSYVGTVEYRFYPTDDNNTYVGCAYDVVCLTVLMGIDGKPAFCLGVAADASEPESSGNPGYTARCTYSSLTQPAPANNFIGSVQFNFNITPNSSANK